MILGQIVLLVYAVVMLAGGLIGFLTARSRPSLAAGTASAVLLAVAWRMSGTEPVPAFWTGAALALALAVLFAVRLARTRKPIPAGALLALSLVAMGLLAYSALRATPA